MKDKDDDNNIGLGDIFKGLNKFINLVGDMLENEKNEVDIRGIINDTEKRKNIIGKYGVNIKIGEENLSGIKDINTYSKITNGSNGEKYLEPITDVFDEDDRVVIVMELPGVEKENIRVEIKENILKLEAQGNGNVYIKDIKLSFIPAKELIKFQLNNSIYSIIIDKGQSS